MSEASTFLLQRRLLRAELGSLPGDAEIDPGLLSRRQWLRGDRGLQRQTHDESAAAEDAADSGGSNELGSWCRRGHFGCPAELPATLIDPARRILGETVDVRELALAQLRQQLASSGFGAAAVRMRADTMFLLSFLRAKKFDVAKAFKMIQSFGEVVAEVSCAPETRQVFARRGDFSDETSPTKAPAVPSATVQRIYDHKLIELLPGHTSTGCRIALVHGANFSDNILAGLKGPALVEFFLWVFSRLCSDPWVQVHGLVVCSLLPPYSYFRHIT